MTMQLQTPGGSPANATAGELLQIRSDLDVPSNAQAQAMADAKVADNMTASATVAPSKTAVAAAIDAKVANDLTASTTVAPSKTAVNTALTAKVNTSLLGAASGVAQLDALGKLTSAQIPDSLIGSLSYQGTWNATTNVRSPAGGGIPAAAAGNKGHYYIVSTAGTTSIDGDADWGLFDWIVSNGAAWTKVDNSDSGSADAATIRATLLTGMAASGTALPTAADSILSAWNKMLGWAGNLATNVLGTVLTGWTVGSNTTVAATDTVTQGIGKLQGQINANVTSIAGKANALTAGTTITTSRNLAAGDIDKITTVDTSSGDVTLTLVSGVFTAAGQAMYFRRSGANDLLFASGTGTVNNTKGVIALDGDLVALMATAANIASLEGDERIRRLQANPASDDTLQGDVNIGLNSAATVAQWEAVTLNSSSAWILADADGSGTFPARGLATSSGTNGNPLAVLTRGIVRNDAWVWTPGADIFLGTTPGSLTQTAPANAQRVGFAHTADVAEFDFLTPSLVLPIGAASGGQVRIPFMLPIAIGDEATALTVGAAKFSFHMPFAMTLTDISAGVTAAPTGAALVVDVNDAGSTIMTANKLSIDATEFSTHTAATPPALTDTALAKGALITIDVDAVGTTIAGAGLKVYFVGYITAF